MDTTSDESLLSIAGRKRSVRRRVGRSTARIALDHKIEVTTRDGTRTRSAFVSASGEAMVLLEKSGQRSIARAEIREVRVADLARGVRKGLIWTAVGAGIGEAICPFCRVRRSGQGSGHWVSCPRPTERSTRANRMAENLERISG